MSESEKETFNISVGNEVYTVPRRHMLHYQEAIQQQCIALMAADEDSEEDEAPRFSIGDVVSLKSGGPRMTVCLVDGDDVACAWFTRAEDDHREDLGYFDRARYAPTDVFRGVFLADCLEY